MKKAGREICSVCEQKSIILLKKALTGIEAAEAGGEVCLDCKSQLGVNEELQGLQLDT